MFIDEMIIHFSDCDEWLALDRRGETDYRWWAVEDKPSAPLKGDIGKRPTVLINLYLRKWRRLKRPKPFL